MKIVRQTSTPMAQKMPQMMSLIMMVAFRR